MRIRSIKPEFWRSPDVADLPRDIRLLWIGLWSYVDDNGVGIDDHRMIAADLFALDDPIEAREFVSRGLATLSRGFQIARYTVSGRSYLYVTGWEQHQRVDKPHTPRYPLPSDPDAVVTSEKDDSRDTLAKPREELANTRDTLAPGTGEQRNRGTGAQQHPSTQNAHDSEAEQAVMLAPQPERAKPRTRDPAADRFGEFWDIYPKRVGKQAAIKAWRKAIKLADADTILAGARRYATARHGEDPQYTAHPSTWLNAGRWDDEPQPARPPTPQVSTGDQRIAQLQALKSGPTDDAPRGFSAITRGQTA